jgi:hypothetical protein
MLSPFTDFLGPKEFSETKFFDLGDSLDLSFSIDMYVSFIFLNKRGYSFCFWLSVTSNTPALFYRSPVDVAN